MVSTGKFGEYIGKHLETPLCKRYLGIWPTADRDAIVAATETAYPLFRELATDLAYRMGYPYPHEDDKNMASYFHRVLRDEI